MLLVYPDTYFFPVLQESDYENSEQFVDKNNDIVLITRDDDDNQYSKLFDEIDEEFINEFTEI